MRISLVASLLLIACETVARAGEFVGAASCATFGCHGNTVTRSTEVWKSSFIQWSQADPHARAFDVLFNERSAKIVELIASDPSDPSGLSDPTDQRFDDNYWRVLEQRCIGCHATPAAQVASSDATIRAQIDARRRGVSCESCHGAASQWLTDHATTRWPTYTPAKQAAFGMTDTKSLLGRAGVCVECHVGPRATPAGKVMDVDHDLIAAGHPRLMFEFNTYLANLPAHWDVQKDLDRHAAAHGPDSFHFDAWLAGQEMTQPKATRKWRPLIIHEAAPSPKGFPAFDFANFDCNACHHRITPSTHRIAAAESRAGDIGDLRAKNWNDDGLLAVLRRDNNQRQARLTVADRIDVLNWLANQATAPETANWNRAIRFYLASCAFADDLPHSNAGAAQLKAKTQALFSHLNSRFTNRSEPTIYDSPDAFDPTDPAYRTSLRAVVSELESVHAKPQK